jgi:hypothetical protein
VVAEDVLATVILRDEAEALRVVEPLHGAVSHVLVFSFLLVFASGEKPLGPRPEWDGKRWVYALLLAKSSPPS